MTLATRKSLQSRRSLRPIVDRLEDRAMMTATPVTHTSLTTLLAEAAKTFHADTTTHVQHTTATHAQHASAVKVDHPKVHAASAFKSSKHVSAAQLKAERKVVQMLTDVTISPIARGITHGGGSPIAGALAPAQVAGAYGVTALGFANQGQGQTIGIIDEFNDTAITSDANTFSAQYGLPIFNGAGGPKLTVYNDTALGPVPSAAGTGVALETSLDVEWAHAMAPKANILLVQVPAANGFDAAALNLDFAYLLQGIQYAATHNASVVSLSYGYHESGGRGSTSFGLPGLYTLNQTYINSNPTNTIAVTVSTGDTSYPGFPGSSANVIGVGGTALTVTSNNTYGSERAWGSTLQNPFDGAGGGGPSAFFTAPTFQSTNKVTVGARYRTIPDVALLADPSTGVSVYDSLDGYGFTVVGGTSLASPLFAGIISLAQQQRATSAKAILTTSQIQNALYSIYNSPNYLTYFHDITAGSNSDNYDGYPGYSATTGYDLASGLGSPKANTLVPFLASLP